MKKQMNLNGMWKLACSDRAGVKPAGEKIKAEVPGDVTVALSNAGKLPKDLFYRENLKEAKWVEKKFWWYETEFTLPEKPDN